MALDPGSIPVNAQPISGALDFGSVPAQNDYMSAYTNALNLNKQNYGNILQGYQSAAASQAAASQAILQGYGNLSGDITNQIQGTDAYQRQALTDQYMAESGKQAQGLVSRGLGNTTVANSVQRGLTLDNAKANVQLSNQMAQLIANYQASIGQAGLNYANQANQQKTALTTDQLKMMERVNSPYPNAKQYSDVAMQQGMAKGLGAGFGGRGLGGGMQGGLSGRTTPGHLGAFGSYPGGGGHRLNPQTEVRQPTLNAPPGRARTQTLGEDQFGGGAGQSLGYNTNPFGSEDGGTAGDANYPAQEYLGGGNEDFSGGNYISPPINNDSFGNTENDFDNSLFDEEDGGGEEENGDNLVSFTNDEEGGNAGQDEDDEDPYGGFYDNYQYSQGDDGSHNYTYDDGSYDTYNQGGDYQGYYGADDSFQGDDWYD